MLTADRREPKVLVLLASFNGQPFIADQLSTILNQTGVRVDVCIRDDGSSDGTLSEIKGRKCVALVDAAGVPTGSAALNFLTMLASVDFEDADYVALSDQDDLWLSDKLRRGVECLQRSGAGGYSCNLSAFDNAGYRAPWLLSKHGKQKEYDHLFQSASAGCTYIFARSCADRIKGWLASVTFPTSLGISHDWLLHAFVRNQRLDWYYDTLALILYRQHANNVYGSKRGLGRIQGRMKLLRRRWYRHHILWLSEQLDLTIAEARVIAKVRRLGLADRLWLVTRAGKLRRGLRDVWLLRLALLTGLF